MDRFSWQSVKAVIDRIASLPATLVLVTSAIVLGYFFCSTMLYHEYQYAGADGDLYTILFRQMFGFSQTGSTAGINPYQGMGSVYLPFNLWITPGYAVMHWVDNIPLGRVFSTNIFILELFASVVFLARAVRLPWTVSLLTAQFCCVASFHNKWRVFGFINQFDLNPGVAHFVALGNCILAMYILLGQLDRRKNLAIVVLMPTLWFYSIACEPLFTAVVCVPYVYYTLAAFCCARSRAELRWKGLCLAVFVAANLAVGTHDFYRALTGNIAREVFRNEIFGEIQVKELAGFAFQGPITRKLFRICLFATACAVVFGARRERRFAAATLLMLLGMVGVGATFQYSKINWTYPLPVYLEYGSYSVYAVVTAIGLLRLGQSPRARNLLRFLWNKWRGFDAEFFVGMNERLGRLGTAVASCVNLRLLGTYVFACGLATYALLELVTTTKIPLSARRVAAMDVTARKPKYHSPIIDELKLRVAIRPGDVFRGNVITVYGRESGPLYNHISVPTNALPGGAYEFVATHFQTRMKWQDMWRDDLPTLDEYGQMVSPPMYYLMSRGLGSPDDYVSRNIMPDVKTFRFPLLAALGVRYAITDADWSDRGFAKCLEVVSKPGVPLRLYELPMPNLGNYSPVTSHLCPTAAGAITQMKEPSFDFRTEVVLHEPLDVRLTPARNATMRFDKGGVHVEAESDGTSLLLLPVQYSHCLTINRTADGTTPAKDIRFIRANIAQTGVVFCGKLNADFSFRFGLGDNVAARLADRDDVRKLELTKDASIHLPPGRHPLAGQWSNLLR
ncbi:MAG: hypothetical protein JNK76_20810 [Planctomycetales bacterium]|nr:hypothetical protein [Planctomycetales bacterium]